MIRYLHVAVVEDDKSERHQFVGYSEKVLNEKVADWVRPRWPEAFGECPFDDGACIEIYFDNMAGPPFTHAGFEHTLTALEPIEITDPEESKWTANPDIPVGTRVLIRRGSLSGPPEVVAPGTGHRRYVKATYLGRDAGNSNCVMCRLEQDDPGDTVGWSKKGQEGFWSASCVRLDPEYSGHSMSGGEA